LAFIFKRRLLAFQRLNVYQRETVCFVLKHFLFYWLINQPWVIKWSIENHIKPQSHHEVS